MITYFFIALLFLRMETTIQYLRELLAREMANKYDKDQLAKLKIELDASQFANNLIRKDFEEEIKKLKLDLNASNIANEALKQELAEVIEEKENVKDKLKVSVDELNIAEEHVIALQNDLKQAREEPAQATNPCYNQPNMVSLLDTIKNLEEVNRLAGEEVFFFTLISPLLLQLLYYFF